MSKRGRGRGASSGASRGRGGASSRGGQRGGSRGGSRQGSGRSTPARNSGKAPRSFDLGPSFPSFEGHGGLGFSSQGSKRGGPAGGRGRGARGGVSSSSANNPLLVPVVFVRGNTQAFDMKSEQPQKPDAAPLPEPSSSKSVDPQPVLPLPVQETAAQRPEALDVELTEMMQDQSLFAVDTTGDASQRSPQAEQEQRPLPPPLQDPDSEDEDQIVYIPPNQPHQPVIVQNASKTLPDQQPQPSAKVLETTTTTATTTNTPVPAAVKAWSPAALLAQAQEREKHYPPAPTVPKEKLTYNEKRRRKREARKRRQSGQQLPVPAFGNNNKNMQHRKPNQDIFSSTSSSSNHDSGGHSDQEGPFQQGQDQPESEDEDGHEDAVVQDYLFNTSRRDPDEDGMDEDPDVDQARMLAFVNGMSQPNFNTIDDLDDAEQAAIDAQYFQERERGGWETEEEEAGATLSSSSSSSSSEEEEEDSDSDTDSEEAEAMAEVDLDVERALAEQLGLDSSETTDDEEEDEAEDQNSDADIDGEIAREDDAGRASMGVKGRLHTKRRDNEQDEDSAEDPFAGGQSWQHDIDAAYIMDTLQLAGSSKSSRKKDKQKLKAISRGDVDDELADIAAFGADLNDEDLMDDLLLQSAAKGSRKGKGKSKKQPQFDSDDEFFEELQAAWEADRAHKAERKSARLAARLANQPSKKTIKAAKRAGLEAPAFHSFKGFNIHAVHEEIRQYVFQGPNTRSDLCLSPMDKKDRVTVHLIAETYGLKSNSKGSGTKRYPCLSRTTRTSALLSPAQTAKIEHILAVSEGRQKASYIGKAGGKRSKGLWKALQGMEASSSDKKQKVKITSHHRNKEGDVVGGGADHLQNDNFGYRMLAKMGWNHGQSMGATGSGIAVPLAATIKTTKKGLGS